MSALSPSTRSPPSLTCSRCSDRGARFEKLSVPSHECTMRELPPLFARCSDLFGERDYAGASAAYDLAHRDSPDDVGVLLAFAHLLTTAPDDSVRDGQRSIEYSQSSYAAACYDPGCSYRGEALVRRTSGAINALAWSRRARSLVAEEGDVRDGYHEDTGGEAW